MTWLQTIVLGIIEGLTEFLPISSTGHMVLASSFLGIAEDPFVKAFEVIIQMGAILTVVVLYWKRFQPRWGFYRKILLAFIPTAILGFLLKSKVDEWLESPLVVAVSLIVGGVVLIFIDRVKPGLTGDTTDDISDATAMKLGFFQSLALCPGVSRAGSTIVGGLLLGMNRADAAEFSFFLAVPTMAAATGYKMLKMLAKGPGFTGEQWGQLALGSLISFVVAGFAIRGFIGFLQKKGFALFGWYRIALGAAIVAAFFAGFELRA